MIQTAPRRRKAKVGALTYLLVPVSHPVLLRPPATSPRHCCSARTRKLREVRVVQEGRGAWVPHARRSVPRRRGIDRFYRNPSRVALTYLLPVSHPLVWTTSARRPRCRARSRMTSVVQAGRGAWVLPGSRRPGVVYACEPAARASRWKTLLLARSWRRMSRIAQARSWCPTFFDKHLAAAARSRIKAVAEATTP